ncbi:MAG: TolC family protein [Bacteroidales bacterium]|nr:TolC family protein [Bacteroidales bacterium]
MNVRNLIIASVLFATPGIGAADTIPDTWSYRECVDYAYSNNISLKKQLLTQQSGIINTEAANAEWLPTLNFATTHGYTNYAKEGSNSYTGTYGLNASWNVWDGGRRTSNIDLNKVQNRIDSYSVEAVRNNLETTILKYYLNILYNREAVTIAENALELSKAQLDRATELMNVGKLSRVDYSQFESQYLSDNSSLVTARGQLQSSLTDLKQMLQLSLDTRFELDDFIPSDDIINVESLPDMLQVYDTALNWLPEIINGQLKSQLQDYNIKIARSGYMPTISLNAGIGTGTNSSDPSKWGEQMGNKLNEQVSVTLSVPIIDQKSASTKTRLAQIDKLNADLDYRQLQIDLSKTIESLFVDANNYIAQYNSGKMQVQSAALTEELTTEKFNLGLVNTVELLTAHTNLLSARMQLLQSKYLAILSIKMINFYQHNLITLP